MHGPQFTVATQQDAAYPKRLIEKAFEEQERHT